MLILRILTEPNIKFNVMKIKSTSYSRREFTKLAAMGISAFPLMSFLQPSYLTTEDNLNIHLFSKHLQFLNYNDMSEAAAEMGFNGLDLTVRPKGHVVPERVIEDLPKAVEAMKKHGLTPEMISTNVWDTKNILQKTVLETASALGITHYRTAWLTYPDTISIKESQILFAKQAKELEILNKNLGIIGGYQNHAGNHVGAAVWDLLPILEKTKGKHLGSQFDIRHAIVEAGESWELELRAIKTYINSIALKDFKWAMVKGRMKPINVPMGEGIIDFKRYFTLLKKHKINVPISLHVEYDLGGAEKGASNITIDKKEVLKRIKKDLLFIRNTWINA